MVMNQSLSHQSPRQSSVREGEVSPSLTLDGKSYRFDALSDRARMLSLDYSRTDQEWQELQRKHQALLLDETSRVRQLEEQIERFQPLPISKGHDVGPAEQDLISIGQYSYEYKALPERLRKHVQAYQRRKQEALECEFKLRQLDAARSAYLNAIRAELDSSLSLMKGHRRGAEVARGSFCRRLFALQVRFATPALPAASFRKLLIVACVALAGIVSWPILKPQILSTGSSEPVRQPSSPALVNATSQDFSDSELLISSTQSSWLEGGALHRFPYNGLRRTISWREKRFPLTDL